jgi:Protein of unknown function (DUF3048) N-terminal domain/Protein of unknown function (DUF3048) C-terminal domain
MLARWMSSRRGAAAVLLVAAGIAAAGCGPGSAVIARPAAGHPTVTGGAAAAAAPSRATTAQWSAPLTGLPVSSARVADRAAVALPVAGDRPHGLAAADVVFEEITTPIRYIAVFQSREDQSVGPVTSTRPTDGQALSVLHPLLGYDGGTAPFIRALDKSDVVDMGYARYPWLYHPGAAGLIASTGQIETAARGTAPPPLFTYQGSGIGSAAQFATAGTWQPSWVQIEAPALGTQQWSFSPRSGRWTGTARGPRVQVANLIIQTVQYKDVNLSTRLGITVPSARVIGKGSALVVSAADGPANSHSGVAVKAFWSKPGRHAVTNYLDSRGVPVGLQPGPTWIILAPPGTQIRTGRGRP